MIALLAPAKKMDFTKRNLDTSLCKEPLFNNETASIAEAIKSFDIKTLKDVMKVSEKIAESTFEMYSDFSNGTDNFRRSPSVFAYKGDTYKGLSAENFSSDDLSYAEEHLRILSALYGVLSPMTFIAPYRLDMKQKLDLFYKGALSGFWKENITSEINRLLESHKNKIIVNLSSAEFTAAINKKKIKADFLEIAFKREKNGKLGTVGSLSKKARGMMASFMVKNRIDVIESLKEFKEDGYIFREDISDKLNFVFV